MTAPWPQGAGGTKWVPRVMKARTKYLAKITTLWTSTPGTMCNLGKCSGDTGEDHPLVCTKPKYLVDPIPQILGLRAPHRALKCVRMGSTVLSARVVQSYCSTLTWVEVETAADSCGPSVK
jgi:hypothetical protein